MKPYYERDGITIYCGDCLEVMPGLESRFDAIICDPPYGQTACAWDSVIPLEGMWINYKRLIKDNGAVVLFGSQPFTSKLVVSNLEWFKYEWIWSKARPTGFVHAKNKPLKYHENIVVFSPGTTVHEEQSKNRMNYFPQVVKGTPYKKSFKTVNAGMMNHKPSQANFDYIGTVKTNDGYRYPTSVINISFHNVGNGHPTQKPVALMSYLIRTYTNPGELILDNAMGSGTTLVAAQNEGRQAVGCDTSEEYCRIAVDRLRQPSFFSIPSNGKAKAEAKQLTLTLDEE